MGKNASSAAAAAKNGKVKKPKKTTLSDRTAKKGKADGGHNHSTPKAGGEADYGGENE